MLIPTKVFNIFEDLNSKMELEREDVSSGII